MPVLLPLLPMVVATPWHRVHALIAPFAVPEPGGAIVRGAKAGPPMPAVVVEASLHAATGLDSLARIASFAAHGFSLIGVGWLHGRYRPARNCSWIVVTHLDRGEVHHGRT